MLAQLSLFLAVVTCFKEGENVKSNQAPQDILQKSRNMDTHGGVRPLIDAGFYPFNFGKGNVGQQADRFFQFTTPSQVLEGTRPALAILDCYCGGDRFGIYNQGELISFPGASCGLATPQCQGYQDDVKICALSAVMGQGDFFCTTNAWLDFETSYNITITTATSFFGGGTAFFFLYTAIDSQIYYGLPVCVFTGLPISNVQPNFPPSFDNCVLDLVPEYK